jgi:hypothetical protein
MRLNQWLLITDNWLLTTGLCGAIIKRNRSGYLCMTCGQHQGCS